MNIPAILDIAAENLKAFGKEALVDIEKAWAQVEDEADTQETAPVLRLGFSIVVRKTDFETQLSFGVKHKLSSTAEIPDPNQIPLLPEGTVRIVTGEHDTGEIPLAKFKTAAKKLNKN